MNTRRDFLKTVAVASCAAVADVRAETAVPPAAAPAPSRGADDRAYWCDVARRLATPVLDALSRRTFKRDFPIEAHAGAKDRAEYTHLEALGRLLAGLAPWLERGADETPEGRLRSRLAELARAGIDAATDPTSPDALNFSHGSQPLVDAAFLAQAMVRAPTELWGRLAPNVRRNVVAALESSRRIQPGENNWKLFASEIESFLTRVGEKRDDERLFLGLRKHAGWYAGDGLYGDGPEFHWDYYNAFVIQPMLLECLETVAPEASTWAGFLAQERERLRRFAQIQERLIAPDGSYPAIGRSIAYRCGAFQGLALAALRHLLPANVVPPQARVALTRVIRRTLEAPGTWDERGWLRIGLAGHQPSLGEPYISTGSLYLCAEALLPLGLAATDPFWSAPPATTTWERVWSGQDLPADHALTGHH